MRLSSWESVSKHLTTPEDVQAANTGCGASYHFEDKGPFSDVSAMGSASVIAAGNASGRIHTESSIDDTKSTSTTVGAVEASKVHPYP